VGEGLDTKTVVTSVSKQSLANWIQFGLLLLTLISFALHIEGRLSHVEQHVTDGDVSRGEIMQQLDRIESRIDSMENSLR
jgi:hypothetical protein